MFVSNLYNFLEVCTILTLTRILPTPESFYSHAEMPVTSDQSKQQGSIAATAATGSQRVKRGIYSDDLHISPSTFVHSAQDLPPNPALSQPQYA